MILLMTKKQAVREYVRIMSCIDIDEEAKKEIIRNCARYGTVKKIKTGRFKAVAAKKRKPFQALI